MAGKVTLDGVNRGDVTVRQLVTLNALMDAEDYQREVAREEANKK